MASDDSTHTVPLNTRARRRPRSPRIIVNISEQRIADSVRRDSRHCMIAEALKEVIPEMVRITVDMASIRFTDPKTRLHYIYATPDIAAIALVDFDRGIQPSPFSFNLHRALHVTRTRGPDLRSDERKGHQAQRRRELREARKHTRAPNNHAPFKPSTEYKEKIIAAMNDPTALLGPAVALDPPTGNDASVPIIVGGRPPRHRGNRQNTRIFGRRALIE